MGKAVLEGLDGIIKVTRGWHGVMEVNTVSYDPAIVSVKEMEDTLKRAGTYRKTVRER